MSKSEVKNWDYFKKDNTERFTKKVEQNPKESVDDAVNLECNEPIAGHLGSREKLRKQEKVQKDFTTITNNRRINSQLQLLITEIKEILQNNGFHNLKNEVMKIENGLANSKFKISVVGEFSRGKSTFINHLLENEILPVGNLPTTALLTKVTYNSDPMLVHVNQKGAKKVLPLSEDSWDGLVADVSKVDPQGVVFIGVESEWLKETGIEIIDTPGAGDLNEKRTSLINDALLCGDGAIITISALQALSLSEKAFIEERLISKKVPHLLLIITRLDQVKSSDRKNVVEYIKEKLVQWNMDIPVLISNDNLEIPEGDYADISGIAKIRKHLESWVSDEENEKLRTSTACTQLLSILNMAQLTIIEKAKLLQLDEDKRKQVLEEQKSKIGNTQILWEDLRLEMLKRCNHCYDWLRGVVVEKTALLVERLQYEAMHASNPKTWWEEDYPYRLKVEMMNLAATLENGLMQIYSNDTKWFSDTLMKQFKASIEVGKESIADKVLFKDSSSLSHMEIEDISKQRLLLRVGTGAATIAGYILFAGLGPVAMISSVSIGTGGAVLGEKMFSNKIKEQRESLQNAIASDVPRVIDKALAVSEQRLNEAYEKVMKEATQQEELWVKTQHEALNASFEQTSSKSSLTILQVKEEFDGVIENTKRFMGE